MYGISIFWDGYCCYLNVCEHVTSMWRGANIHLLCTMRHLVDLLEFCALCVPTLEINSCHAPLHVHIYSCQQQVKHCTSTVTHWSGQFHVDIIIRWLIPRRGGTRSSRWSCSGPIHVSRCPMGRSVRYLQSSMFYMIRQLEHLTRDLILGILDYDQLTIPGPILRYWINGPCTSLLRERKK